MYDVIIVGARYAGAPAAMLLARRGYRVLLVDKAAFPSDSLSDHYLQPAAVNYLDRWGVLDRVAQSGCPAIRELRCDFGEEIIDTNPTHAPGRLSAGYCPRRYVLDTVLAEQAVRDGAELREGFTVERLVMDGERVVGIQGISREGREVTESARIVIGADGLNSIVARRVDAPMYDTSPSRTCSFHTFWSGVACDSAELYVRSGGRVFAAPTNDGQTMITVTWPEAIYAGIRPNVERHFREALRSWAPDLAARVNDGVQADRFYGTSRQPTYFRKPYGSGWALLGDAGAHVEGGSITGCGVAATFHDAEVLSEAIDAGLSGRVAMTVALADYEVKRNGNWSQLRGVPAMDDMAWSAHEICLRLSDVHTPVSEATRRQSVALMCERDVPDHSAEVETVPCSDAAMSESGHGVALERWLRRTTNGQFALA